MTVTQELVGFEGQDYTGVTSLSTGPSSALSTFSARSGAYGLRLTPNNESSYGVSVGPNAQVGPRLAYAVYLQFYVRFNRRPSTDNSMFAGLVNGDLTLGMNIDGKLRLTKAGVGTVLSSAPPLGIWLRFVITTWVDNDSPLPSAPSQLRTTVQWMWRSTVLGILQNSDTIELNGDALNAHNYLQAILGSQGGVATTWDVDIDDVIYLAAPSLADMNSVEKWLLHDNHGAPVPNVFLLGGKDYYPSLTFYDRIFALKITAEAPGYGFTPANDADVIKALPSAAARAPLATAAGIGVPAIYFKEQVAAQNELWYYHILEGPEQGTTVLLSLPKTIEGYQLKGNATSSPAGDHQLLLDSLTPAPPRSTLDNTTSNGDFNSPRTPARIIYGTLGHFMPVSQFNRLQMELIDETGALVSLKNLYVEYLAQGDNSAFGPAFGYPERTTPGAPPGPPGLETQILQPPYAAEACANPPNPSAGSAGSGGCDVP
jgi:hypothetical protein